MAGLTLGLEGKPGALAFAAAIEPASSPSSAILAFAPQAGMQAFASSGDEQDEEYFSNPSSVPSWLCRLLKTTFFRSCPEHRHLRKSDTLFYCLHCQTPPPGMCQHCKVQHDAMHDHTHSVLQIRRYVYQDVVRTGDLRSFFCPMNIQQYTINGAEVVFLRPRPTSKAPERQDDKSEPCWTCGRHCRSPMHFCSLACKVHSMLQRKGRVQGPLPPGGWSLSAPSMAPPTPPRPMTLSRPKASNSSRLALHMLPHPGNLLPRILTAPAGAGPQPAGGKQRRRKQPCPRCAPF